MVLIAYTEHLEKPLNYLKNKHNNPLNLWDQLRFQESNVGTFQ